MDFESVRPLITGALGGLFTLWLMGRWARFVPRAYQEKSAKELTAEHRASLIVANVLFFGTLAVGIYVFKAGLVPANSWAHFALIVGVAFVAPAAAVVLPAIGKGKEQIGEAIAAFAIAERTPIPVLAAIVLLGVICLTSAIGGLL